MLIKSTTLQVEGTTLQLRCSSSNLDPPRSNLGQYQALRCKSPVPISQSGAPELMQRKTKCSPSFPKETAESAQSYLHPGSGEWAPDWKIPLPFMETWSNNVTDHTGTGLPRQPQCLCITGCACLGHAEASKALKSTQFSNATSWPSQTSKESALHHPQPGWLWSWGVWGCCRVHRGNTEHTMQSALHLSPCLAGGRTLPKASIPGLHIN